ncbi:MAG: OmpP1/FadL family transporter [Lactobacillus sp.]|nr:OmpP1/FadL family transporter [Lactobacillus sp.]
MKKIVTLAAISGVFCATNVMAAGFNLREQSVAALGNAFAGATAGAEDISYSYWNPAGLTRHKGTQVNLGATWVAPRSKAKVATANIPTSTQNPHITAKTGDIVDHGLLPTGYMSYQIDDHFTTAIAVNSPFGMTTKYEGFWAGRTHGTTSKVQTVTVTPTVAYKVHGHENLSLGAGLQIQYIKAKLSNSVPAGLNVEDSASLEGDTTDVGYTLGALYEFNPSTRVGVGYRSQIKHKLKGQIDFNGPLAAQAQTISARLTTPAILSAGIYHDINDRWAVMGEVSQTYWSSFDELRIKGRKGLLSVTEENWKDTTFYGVGVNYRVNDQWKLRAGVAFDQGAVGDEYRTPRIPEADRKWYSLGAEYRYNENLTINAGYTYIRANDGRVGLRGDHYGDVKGNRGSLYATYSNDVHIGGIGLNYAF